MPTGKNPVNCNFCGKQINRRGDLTRHQLTHSKNPDALKFPCPYPGCEYKTFQRSNLATHINIHTGERPHVCPDCGLKVSDPASLTRHREEQHGYVPRENSRRKQKSKKSQRHAPYTIPSRSSGSSNSTTPLLSASCSSSSSSAVDAASQAPLADRFTTPSVVAQMSSSSPSLLAVGPMMLPTWRVEQTELPQTEYGNIYSANFIAQSTTEALLDEVTDDILFSKFPFLPSSDAGHTYVPPADGHVGDMSAIIPNALYDYLDQSPDALPDLGSTVLSVCVPIQYPATFYPPANGHNIFMPSISMHDGNDHVGQEFHAYGTEGACLFATGGMSMYPQEVEQTSHGTAGPSDEGPVFGSQYLSPYFHF